MFAPDRIVILFATVFALIASITVIYSLKQLTRLSDKNEIIFFCKEKP
jgi:hypothetical protein